MDIILAFVLFATNQVYPKVEPAKTMEGCLVEAAKRNKIDPDVTSALGQSFKAEWVCLKVNRVTV